MDQHYPCSIFGRWEENPRGEYVLIAKENNIGEYSDFEPGIYPIRMPELTDDTFEHHCDYFRTNEVTSVYLQAASWLPAAASKRKNIEFCNRNPQLTHVVLCKDTAPLDCVKNLEQLEWLEVLGTNQVASLGLFEKLRSLKVLVIKRCNNFFAADIPEVPSLEELVLKNIARFTNCHELMQKMPTNFPSVHTFILNECKSSFDSLYPQASESNSFDLSPLSEMAHIKLSKFQAIGTRVLTDGDWNLDYVLDREQIERYLEKIGEDAKRAFFGWEHVHQLDLETLHDEAPGVEHITIAGSCVIDDLSILDRFENLSRLTLIECSSIRNLKPLCDIKDLTQLKISDCKNVSDYKPISKCRNVRELSISGGVGEKLTEQEYRQQLSWLFENSRIREQDWDCDVAIEELEEEVEGRGNYLDLVAEELMELAV